MTCLICKSGETAGGTTTITYERGRTVLVVKDVPAQVCSNCGEVYVDEKTSATLLQQAESAVASGVQVEVRAFAA